jgi:hypothetical protein
MCTIDIVALPKYKVDVEMLTSTQIQYPIG